MEGIKERIVVIDSPPGSGKTSKMIEYINSLPEDQKVLYITPFLDECERVQLACAKKNFKQPTMELGNGSKKTHFLSLLQSNENIASTHALFAKIDEEIMSALRSRNYILILDETFQVLNKFSVGEESKGNSKLSQEYQDKITAQDVTVLKDKGIISVDDEFVIHWVDDNIRLSRYSRLKTIADRGLLYLVHGSLLMWSFPCDIFREGIFDEIYVLTYLFNYQLQKYYYDYFKIAFTKYHIEKINNKYELIKTENYDYEKKFLEEAKSLIHILDNYKLNKIGSNYTDAKGRIYDNVLSVNWYKRNNKDIQIMRNNIVNFFTNITKSKSADRMWTCYEQNKIPSKKKKDEEGNSLIAFKTANLTVNDKIWVPLNSRSTNKYGEKSVLAYPLNRFADPFYKDFFTARNIKLSENGLAISEFIQWIWRSRIRNDKPIQIYIPSERMRNLLKDFLDGNLHQSILDHDSISDDE